MTREGLQMPQSKESKPGSFVFEPGFTDSTIPEKSFRAYTPEERAELIRIITGVAESNLSPKLRRFREEYYNRREEEFQEINDRPDGKSQP